MAIGKTKWHSHAVQSIAVVAKVTCHTLQPLVMDMRAETKHSKPTIAETNHPLPHTPIPRLLPSLTCCAVRSSGGGIGSKRYSEPSGFRPSPRNPLSANPSEADLASPSVQAYFKAMFDATEELTHGALSPPGMVGSRAMSTSPKIPELKEDLAPRQPARLAKSNSLPTPLVMTAWRTSPAPSPVGTKPAVRAHTMQPGDRLDEEDEHQEAEVQVVRSRNGRPRPGPPPSFDEDAGIARAIDWDVLERSAPEQEDTMVRYKTVLP